MKTAENRMLLHPAVALVAWLALLVIASALWQGWLVLPRQVGLLTATVVIALALFDARQRFIALLRRARWLLVSVVLLGIWTTPGLEIGRLLGATYDGLSVTSVQLVQLLLTFAMVALLLKHLSIGNLLLGLHTLAAPLATVGFAQDRSILRLVLTLAELETKSANPKISAQFPLPLAQSLFVFPVRRFSIIDFLLLGLVGAVVITGFVYVF